MIQIIHSFPSKDQLIRIQNIEQVERPGRQHLHRSDIPTGQPQIIGDLLQQEHGLAVGADPPALDGRNEVLGLRPVVEPVCETLDDDSVSVEGGAGESSGDRKALLLAVDLDRPVTGPGAEDDTTAGTKRGAGGATTGSAGLLLGVGLSTTASDLAAGEGGRRAPALVLEVGDEASVDDGASGVGRGIFQVEKGFADYGAVEGEDGDSSGVRADGNGVGMGEGFEAIRGFEVREEIRVLMG